MAGNEMRLDEHRIMNEPYYLVTGQEVAVAEAWPRLYGTHVR